MSRDRLHPAGTLRCQRLGVTQSSLAGSLGPRYAALAMREIRSSLLVPALLVSIAGGSLRAASEQSAPVAPLAKTEDRSMESARKLISEGKYSEAKTELSAIVAEDQQQRGPQDFQTMADRLELAIAEGKLNRSLEAETEMRTLLAIFVRRCGPDHDETLRCRGALAQLLTDTARPTEAVKEYRQILDSRERMLGDDDLEVARVRHLLGDALAVAGGIC
ncbi:MAG: tetratricopeptide repeat protein [Chthoniobacter sp.]